MSITAIKWALNQSQIEDAREVWLLVVLADFMNEETGQCNPSWATLKEKSRIGCRNTLGAKLKALQSKGLIAIEARPGSSNSYRLNLPIEKPVPNLAHVPNIACTKTSTGAEDTSIKTSTPTCTKTSTPSIATSTKTNTGGGVTSTKTSTPPVLKLVQVPSTPVLKLVHKPLYIDISKDISNKYIYPPFAKVAQNKTDTPPPDSTPKPEKKPRRKKPVIECPFHIGDKIPDELAEVAKKYGIKNPQLLFERLISYCESSGRKYADYKAAYRNFCMNERDRNASSSNHQQSGSSNSRGVSASLSAEDFLKDMGPDGTYKL